MGIKSFQKKYKNRNNVVKVNTYRAFPFILLLLSFYLYSCQNNKSEPGKSNEKDTNAVIELLKNAYKNIGVNSKSAIEYGNKATELAQTIDYKKGYVKGMLYIGQVHMVDNDYVLAKRYFISALKYSKENELNDFTPVCLGSLGIVSERLCNYDESIKYYKQCQEAYIHNHDSVGIIKSKINISNSYSAIGERSKAANELLSGIKIAEAINNDEVKCICLNNLSILYQAMGKNDEALKYLFETENISKKTGDTANLANVYNNIGLTYQALNKSDLALKYYIMSAEIRRQMNDKNGISIAYNNIGSLRYDAKDYPTSLEYFKKAYNLSQETHNLLSSSKYLKNISDALIEMGRVKEAIGYLNKSLSIAYEINASNEKSTALFALSDAYEKSNDYKQAYKYFKAYATYSDSLNILQNNKAVEELKIQYESEKKEQQINRLEKEKELAKTNQILLIGLIILTAFIGILIFLWQRNKYLKNRQLTEFEQSLMHEKLEISKLEQNSLKQKLEFKEKELVNLALIIVQKIEFIDSLKNEIKNLQKDSNVTKSDILNKINLLISSNSKIDKELSEFRMRVDNVNKTFFKKLEEKFPTITENEKKLSALLRINLSSKDIASINNISPSSVDMSRYRLRKKLNLSNKENIVDFLNSL